MPDQRLGGTHAGALALWYCRKVWLSVSLGLVICATATAKSQQLCMETMNSLHALTLRGNCSIVLGRMPVPGTSACRKVTMYA